VSTEVSTEAATDEVLYEIELMRYPLRLGARAGEHYEAVFRELALLASSQVPGQRWGQGPGPRPVPDRMAALIDALGCPVTRTSGPEQRRDDALARGETTVDISVLVPASVAGISVALDSMLDETDGFCRDGTLLTIGAPDDVVAFRRWYLGELAGQLGGGPATPWPDDAG